MFLRPLKRMLKDTTLAAFTAGSKSGKILSCTGSHHPPALCRSLQTAAFFISLSYVSVASFAVNSSSLVLPSRVALPSLTYFYAYESVHTAATLEVKGA